MENLSNGLSPLIQQALIASQANDSDTALRLFHQASQEEPNSALPHFLMGAELAQLGRMAEAEAAYANAVLLAPDFAIARFELGVLQFTSARAAMAMVTWQPLLAMPDTEPLKLFVRGYAELAQDAFDNALHYFEQGISLNHTNPPLNGNIQLLITEIRRVQGVSSMGGPIAESSETTKQDETSNDHFLLSAYLNQGKLH